MPYMTGKGVGNKDGDPDDQNRKRGGVHADRDSLNDGRCRSGLGGFDNRLDRRPVGGGIPLGEQADENSCHQTRDHRQGDAPPSEFDRIAGDDIVDFHDAGWDQKIDGDHRADDHQHPGAKGTAVQSFLRIAPFLGLDKGEADNRGDDSNTGDRQWQIDGIHASTRLGGFHADIPACPQDHRRDDRPDVGLEQVGAHAGHVADVVAHVVGDGRRIQRMIFGDPRLDLAHQVRANIGRLGVDTATNTSEQGDRGGSQRKSGEDIEHQHRRIATLRAPRDTSSCKPKNKPPRPNRARPTTDRPITEPPLKATCNASLRPLRAAEAVRIFEAVAVFMPKKPASAEQIAPRHKRERDQAIGLLGFAQVGVGSSQQQWPPR